MPTIKYLDLGLCKPRGDGLAPRLPIDSSGGLDLVFSKHEGGLRILTSKTVKTTQGRP